MGLINFNWIRSTKFYSKTQIGLFLDPTKKICTRSSLYLHMNTCHITYSNFFIHLGYHHQVQDHPFQFIFCTSSCHLVISAHKLVMVISSSLQLFVQESARCMQVIKGLPKTFSILQFKAIYPLQSLTCQFNFSLSCLSP